MSFVRTGLLPSLGQRCRLVVAALTSRFTPGRSTVDLLDLMQALPLRQQVPWIGGVLALLFAVALLAAQFGPTGLVVFFAAVVFLIR